MREGAERFEAQPASHGNLCVYIGEIPQRCITLSPVPGKVCGKGIEVHCGGKGIVWAADPECAGQREDQSSEKRSGVAVGGVGEGQGHMGTVVCPSLSLSEQVS